MIRIAKEEKDRGDPTGAVHESLHVVMITAIFSSLAMRIMLTIGLPREGASGLGISCTLSQYTCRDRRRPSGSRGSRPRIAAPRNLRLCGGRRLAFAAALLRAVEVDRATLDIAECDTVTTMLSSAMRSSTESLIAWPTISVLRLSRKSP